MLIIAKARPEIIPVMIKISNRRAVKVRVYTELQLYVSDYNDTHIDIYAEPGDEVEISCEKEYMFNIGSVIYYQDDPFSPSYYFVVSPSCIETIRFVDSVISTYNLCRITDDDIIDASMEIDKILDVPDILLVAHKPMELAMYYAARAGIAEFVVSKEVLELYGLRRRLYRVFRKMVPDQELEIEWIKNRLE